MRIALPLFLALFAACKNNSGGNGSAQKGFFGFLKSQPKTYVDSCRQGWLEGATIPFRQDGRFVPECAPDTLYTWIGSGQQEALVDAVRKNDLALLIDGRGHYFWRSPAGSFLYGPTSLRIKLRKDIRFELLPTGTAGTKDCSVLAKTHDASANVFICVIKPFGYHDYILCHPGPVESLSYATPEHLA